MPILHIANTNFEEENAAAIPLPFPEAMESHPLYLQLQFLPFLYGNEEDFVYTTAAPDERFFTRLHDLGIKPPQLVHRPPEHAEVQSWGSSPSISHWAKCHHLHYESPSWDIVQELNSKAFSFVHAPQLPGAALLHDWDALSTWYKHIPGEKVLKTCFGASGRGHFHLKNLDDPSLLAFAKREWDLARPLIAEPWVERSLDFSTQWYLEKKGTQKYIGFTICQNDAKGHYRGTVVGDPKQFPEHSLRDLGPLFSIHLEEAEKLLNLMHVKGYFGHVGFDAMIYQKALLQPIVEINARKTMGWAAIALRNLHFPTQHALRIFLSERSHAKNPLLPFKITSELHGQMTFQKQLCVEFVDL